MTVFQNWNVIWLPFGDMISSRYIHDQHDFLKRGLSIIAWLKLTGIFKNLNFQKSVVSGSYLTLDKSMIKSFHHELKGKIKIIRKPRPVGNKIKNISDASSHIVMNLGLYEGKELMAYKTHVKEYGGTTATGQFHENVTPVTKFKSLWNKTYLVSIES